MSSSDTWVTVDSKDGCSELYLQNHRYEIVASGIGRLDAHVSPGLYKLRQRVGDVENSRVVEVHESEALHLTLEGIAFASPIPLEGTSSSHEFQRAALAVTGQTTSSQGTGQLWLLLRDPGWTFGEESAERVQHLDREIARLRIESLDGTYSAALADISETRREAGFTRLSAELKPGSYVLTQRVDEQTQRCMPLTVLQRWALHVFINVVVPAAERSSQLNLDRASLVYAQPGAALHPMDSGLLLLETARKAFSRRRASLAQDLVDRILDGKFVNPMLGLLGAHMLLNLPEMEAERAGRVIDNTADLLGEDVPDIIALRMRLVERGIARPPPRPQAITAPPMLAASWNVLAPHMSLVLWFPFTVETTTTWFIWNEAIGVRAAGVVPEEEESRVPRFRAGSSGAREPSLESTIEELLAHDQLQAWVRELKKAERKSGKAPTGLGAADRNLLAVLASAQASLIPELFEAHAIAKNIVRGLNLPSATSRRSVNKLLDKLNEWQASRPR